MRPVKRTAVFAGILFIVATASAVLSALFVPPLDVVEDLRGIAANGSQVMIGVFLQLIMVASVFTIPVVLFPILRKQGDGVARLYFAVRVFEAVFLVLCVVGLVLLLTLSREYVSAETTDLSHMGTTGALLLAMSDWGSLIGGQILLSLAALILNLSMYRSRLVPRLLTVWGLIGVPLMFASAALVMFGVVANSSAIQTALMLPLAVQEMAFALWLIVKGFSPAALGSA